MANDVHTDNIAAWSWDFGDGNTSHDSSATSHVYGSAGIYTVTLTITDIVGCTDQHSAPVTVFGPKAAFNPSVAGACLGSGPIAFTDSSTTDGTHAITKWIWNYGDGTFDSTSAPPYMHNYTTSGDFAVSLTVVDDYGCRDSVHKNSAVVIAQPVAGFRSDDSLSCTDHPVTFINTSTGHELQCLWDFGDGTTSTALDPVHYYSSIGVYTVRLFITDQFGCKDSVTKTGYINISFPKARFNISDSFSTCPPLQVSFSNASTNYSTLQWDFGDGNNSDLGSPSHVYTYPGIYMAKLVATGPGGCKDSSYKQIEVRGPRGSFVYGPLEGCSPLTVSFTATTIDRLSFLWDFSDGNTSATTDSVLSHTYSFPGNYVPKMILEDVSGCRVPIVGRDTIRVIGVNARIALSQSRMCDSGYVSFYDSTTSTEPIASRLWNFGDGSTSTERQPVHLYTVPGVYNVTLSVTTVRGCTDVAELIDTVRVFASPVVAINGDTSACVPAQLNFTAQVIRGDPATLSWTWSLGNGNTSGAINPPSQLYSTAGTFTVIMIVADAHGCKDTASKAINIHPLPLTDAGPNAMICQGSSVQLNATGANTYLWNAALSLSCTSCADPLASPIDQTSYVVTGTSEFGCIKRDSLVVRVQKPFVLTIGPDDTICAGESTRLLASGADQYSWSPSAGLDNSSTASPHASPANSTVYSVRATDSLHCFTDTGSVFIKVYPIPTVDAGKDATIIVGNTVQLQGTGSTDVTTWRWVPPYNLSCNNCPNPVAAPKKTTQYTLEVRNQGGCINKDELTIYVNCNNGELFMPNTFSPNGDGVNDRFYPRAKGTFIIRSLRIFDRWGELVFEKLNFSPNDASAGWDGKFKGRLLSPDVFIYTLEIQCENNETLNYSGDITLIQ